MHVNLSFVTVDQLIPIAGTVCTVRTCTSRYNLLCRTILAPKESLGFCPWLVFLGFLLLIKGKYNLSMVTSNLEKKSEIAKQVGEFKKISFPLVLKFKKIFAKVSISHAVQFYGRVAEAIDLIN